ncbi:MAG: OmpH family outer membrane protein [Salinivirgaceae bacterium]|nr:OmpH family outer membrane protein [Salinivirgaceae bacterium]
MKKTLIIILALAISGLTMAQKFAYVDTDYILKSIPTYESAQEQLEIMSSDWQAEVEAQYAEIEKLYNEFQAEKVLLTEDMKQQREEEIIQKERIVKNLQKKYFGPEGDLFRKRKELIEPIQNDIFNAIKEIATDGNYGVIFDASGGANFLYSDPKYDKSDLVLEKLGFKN